jgi:hypothetical protein
MAWEFNPSQVLRYTNETDLHHQPLYRKVLSPFMGRAYGGYSQSPGTTGRTSKDGSPSRSNKISRFAGCTRNTRQHPRSEKQGIEKEIKCHNR